MPRVRALLDRLVATFAIAAACLHVATVGAAAPGSEPVLRVETPMHTALIRRIAFDPRTERLVTASDDKTIRVWQLPGARLAATLRVPIDAGHEGQLFALALSPDGRRIAAAGWTCWDWERASCIYVFDAESGAIVQRVRGLSDAVSALAWSPDGRILAVGLQGRAGVRFLRTDTFAEVAADRAYEDKVMELAYDRRGRLAAVALDGRLRLYRADHRLHGRITLAEGRSPATVRFAPDDARLAVGFLDAAAVSMVTAETLAVAATHRIAADDAQRSLASVAWSADGAHLYAAGERRGEGPNAIARIDARSGEIVERIEIPARRVSELATLSGNRIAYAAEDPRLGVIGADGRVLVDRAAELTDFAASELVLRVSADAMLVGYTAADGSERVFAANAPDGRAPPTPPALAPPRREWPGWTITLDERRERLTLNGRAVRLDDYEIVRGHAFAPDGRTLVVGTEWTLRALDAGAAERWSVRLAAIAWQVNVSGDGRYAVAALSDGTIRWYRMRDGVEALAYFPHAGGTEWVAWVRAGYYMSSAHGDNLVGWHLNRGAEVTPDFYRAVQFERVLYRPELVTAALAGGATRSGAPTAATPLAALDAARLREIAPPRLAIRPLGITRDAEGRPRVRVRLVAERGAAPLADLAAYVNDVPVLAASERKVSWLETNRLERTVELPIDAGENEIRVESATGVSMGVAEALVIDAGPRGAPRRGDLYILAIGANAFPQLPPASGLQYAVRDAEALAATLAANGRALHRDVHTLVLSDDRERKPDRANVLAALEFAERARAEDTLVVFLASHGVSDRAGNYWFVPRDARAEDLAAIERAAPDDVASAFPSLVSWTHFFDALRRAAGRRILVVDTCQARGMEGRFAPFSLAKRSAASRFSLVVAAQADEESQEYPPARHGLFTYALLQGLAPEADTDGDGQVSVGEMFAAARPIVARLRDRTLGEQTPELIATPALARTPLARR